MTKEQQGAVKPKAIRNLPGENTSDFIMLVLESMTDAFVSLDNNWCYTYMNKKAGEIFGKDPKEMIGKHIWTIFPEGIDQPFKTNYEKAMREQVPILLEEYYPPYDKWFENRIQPTKEGLAIFFQDITLRKKTELALKQSEEKYRALVESANDSILIVQNGLLVFANHIPYELSGYSSNEVIGTPFIRFIDETDRPKVLDHYQRRIKGETAPFNYETNILLKNGEKYPVEINISLFNYQGENAELVFMRDISERKLLEETRDQERLLLKTLINHLPTSVFVKDRQLRKTTANKSHLIRMAHTLGVKGPIAESDVLGKTDFDIYPKEIAEEYYKEDLKVIQNGEVILNRQQFSVTPNGKSFWEMISKIPLKDDEGNITGMIGIAYDITEIQQSREALSEREKQLSSIYDTVENVIFFLEVEKSGGYRFISANQAFVKVTGIPLDAIIGKKVHEVIPEPSLTFVLERYKEAIESKKVIHWEETTDYPTGQLTGIASVAPVFDIHGRCTHLVGSVQDITERKKAEEEISQLNQLLEKRVTDRTAQLESVNKDLEAFGYSVSHDLRAPLRHIDGFSRLLMKQLSNPSDETTRLLSKITESAEKMAGMIDALLQFSRLGRKELMKSEIDLNILVDRLILQFKPETENRDIKFSIGHLPTVFGDLALLKIVFENLISNAIKFTSKKEKAEIEIGEFNPGTANHTIFIKDNGAGFNMAYADKLFNVFQRLHTTAEFDGTGIGLANVKQIIQKHGGSIRAESTIENGATFFITF